MTTIDESLIGARVLCNDGFSEKLGTITEVFRRTPISAAYVKIKQDEDGVEYTTGFVRSLKRERIEGPHKEIGYYLIIKGE